MIFKLKLKNQEEKEYTQILTAIVTSGKSECYAMSEIEDFEIIGCGGYGNC